MQKTSQEKASVPGVHPWILLATFSYLGIFFLDMLPEGELEKNVKEP